MRKLFLNRPLLFLPLFLANVASPAHTLAQNEAAPKQSIDCIADKLPIADIAAGEASVEELRPRVSELAAQCETAQGWTDRQTLAATLAVNAELQLAKNRLKLKETPFASDLPDRLFRKMPISGWDQLMTAGNAKQFNAAMKVELAVPGSVLNDDGSVDDLSVEESRKAGVPLGGAVIALHMMDGFGGVFADPKYEPTELYTLMRKLIFNFGSIELRLK